MACIDTVKIAAVFALVALPACTLGGSATPPGGGGGGGKSGGQTFTVNVSLTQFAPTPTTPGESGGYSPPVLTIPVGSTVVFKNVDGFSHTATLIPNASRFPAGSPFGASAQTQQGSAISQAWSSGVMAAGSSSQGILVDKAGTYLFGCFFHYGSPMRASIVAQ